MYSKANRKKNILKDRLDCCKFHESIACSCKYKLSEDQEKVIIWLCNLCKLISIPYKLDKLRYFGGVRWSGNFLGLHYIGNNFANEGYFEGYIELFIHEICHWIIASPIRRQYNNFGHYKEDGYKIKYSLNRNESYLEEEIVVLLSYSYFNHLLKSFYACYNILSSIYLVDYKEFSDHAKIKFQQLKLINNTGLPIYLP